MSEGSLSATSSSSLSSLWESMTDWFTPKILFLLLNVMIGTIVFTSSLANHKQKHQNRHQNEQPKNSGSITRSASVLQRLKSINLYAHYYRSHEEPQNHNLDSNSHFRDLNSSDSDHTHHFLQDHYSQEHLSQSVPIKPQDSYIYHESERTQIIFNQKDPVLDGSSQAQKVESETQFSFGHKDQNFNDFPHLLHEEKTQSQFAFDQTNDFTQAHEEKTSSAAEQSMDEVYSQLKGGGNHFDRGKSDTKPRSGEIPAKTSSKMRKSWSLRSAFGHFEEDEVSSVESRRPVTTRAGGSAKATDGDAEVDAKADDFISKFKQQLQLQRLDSIIRYKDMIARGRAKG